MKKSLVSTLIALLLSAETDVPGIFNVLEMYTITGGTGRFAGASRRLTSKTIELAHKLSRFL